MWSVIPLLPISKNKSKTNQQRSYQTNLQSISKSEMDLLIREGIIKCVHGRYLGLITGGSHHTKSRWVEPPIYEKLLELQQNIKLKEVI
jgi:hypothetical protein